MNNTDKKVISFVKGKLLDAGFSLSKWDLKEIPVEEEVYTFQNLDDTVEFSAFVTDGKITLGYDDLDDKGFLIDKEAYTIQEAIENKKMEKQEYHHGHDNYPTIFEQMDDNTLHEIIKFSEKEKKELDDLYGKLVKSSISDVYETMCALLKSSNYPALNTYVDNSLITEVDLLNLFYKLLPIEVVKGESKK